jgi:DNA-binding transcriptional ArsR family regulator
MTDWHWGSFPRWWVRTRMKHFTAGKEAGTHMAALRIYLALALLVDFNSRSVTSSWTDLQTATGLSRPMLPKGLQVLEVLGLIDVARTGRRHTYRLVQLPDQRAFAKVPSVQLREALPEITTRGYLALNALKIYIVLLCLLPRDASFRVKISHKTLVEWTGIQPNRIRAALDVLINHDLLHINKSESAGHHHNEYQLRGFRKLRRPDDDFEEPIPVTTEQAQ